jgi:hypothetical protein
MPNSAVLTGLCPGATAFPALKRRAIIEKSLRDSAAQNLIYTKPVQSLVCRFTIKGSVLIP